MASSIEADRLAKAIHPFVSEAFKDPRRVRELGWHSFLNHDRPQTSDPIEMAIAALMHLGRTEDGNWNGVVAAVSAVVAFLNARTGKTPAIERFAELKAELETKPINEVRLKNWFVSVYR